MISEPHDSADEFGAIVCEPVEVEDLWVVSADEGLRFSR